MRITVLFFAVLTSCAGQTFGEGQRLERLEDAGDAGVDDAPEDVTMPRDAGNAFLPLPPTCQRSSCAVVYGYTATAECGTVGCNVPEGCSLADVGDGGVSYDCRMDQYFLRPELFACTGAASTPVGCTQMSKSTFDGRTTWCCP